MQRSGTVMCPYNRERQVMALGFPSLMNKQVGGELGISEITVKETAPADAKVMKKMKGRLFAELVKRAARARLPRVRKACYQS